MTFVFTLLKGDFSICRLNKGSSIPSRVYDSSFYSVTNTQDELSIVCNTLKVTPGDDIKIDKDWRIFKMMGPLDLSQVGIIASIANLLKENNIPIFTISTFDTDYILVKDQDLNNAMTALVNTGHKILIEK